MMKKKSSCSGVRSAKRISKGSFDSQNYMNFSLFFHLLRFQLDVILFLTSFYSIDTVYMIFVMTLIRPCICRNDMELENLVLIAFAVAKASVVFEIFRMWLS